MNRRDYFAAQALNGMLAHGTAATIEQCTVRAFEIADAMISASPPSMQAIRDSACTVAQLVESCLLSELNLAKVWRTLDNDTRSRIMESFVNAASRELQRHFKQETT